MQSSTGWGLLLPQLAAAVPWLNAVAVRTCLPVAVLSLPALSPGDPDASLWPRCALGRLAHGSAADPSPPSRSRSDPHFGRRSGRGGSSPWRRYHPAPGVNRRDPLETARDLVGHVAGVVVLLQLAIHPQPHL